LGHDWLQAANPVIDSAAGWLTFKRKIPYSDLDLTQIITQLCHLICKIIFINVDRSSAFKTSSLEMPSCVTVMIH
jgi:hypothetical protein